MFSKIYALMMFNILDFFFTNKLFNYGYNEGNPILAYFLGDNNPTDKNFLYTRLILIPILCFTLYIISQFRKNQRIMNIYIDVLLIIYGLINSLHIYIFLKEGIFTL